MTPVQQSVQAFIDTISKLDPARSSFVGDIDSQRAHAVAALKDNPSIMALEKAAPGAGSLLIDCALVVGLTLTLQRLLAESAGEEWKTSARGQARAHEYVDLWTRTTANSALCLSLLSGADATLPAQQLRARIEALAEGVKHNLLQSSQALMSCGGIQTAAGVTELALRILRSSGAAELSGSILKELQDI